MTCSKELQITVTSFPQPLAWWTMDLGIPTAEIDSVNGLTLIPIAGGGFMTTQPGKVNNGYQHVSSVGQSVVSVRTSANLALSGLQGQASVVLWCNVISVNNPLIINNTGISFQFDQNAATFILNAQRLNTGFWRAQLDGLGTLQLADPGGWAMIVVTFDCATSTVGLSVNNSALSTQVSGASPTPGAHTTGTIVVGTDANDAWTVRFDELAIFDVVLDASQIDHLWNSGNGRTYPP